jgi:hypothetical protein
MTTEKNAVVISDRDRQEVLDLIQWLKTNRPDLVKKASTHDNTSEVSPEPLLNQLGQKALKQLWVDAQSLHGQYHVTSELEKSAAATTGIINTSNWLDIIGNFPIFLFAFKSLPFFLPFVAALLMSIPLLAASNACSTAVAQGHKGRWKLALAALTLGLIPLNILQTVASGIGFEVLNNQAELVQIEAGKALDSILESKQQNYKELKASSPVEILLCQQETQLLNKMPRFNPIDEKAFQSRYVRLFGTFANNFQRIALLPKEQLPLCVRANQSAIKYEQSLQTVQNDIQNLRYQRKVLGNDAGFLKKEAPSQYERLFVEGSDKNIEISSGIRLVTIGTESFIDKMKRGQWSQLGLSLFFVNLSAITSLASISMGVTFALSADNKKSYDDSHKERINLFFQRSRMTLSQMHDEERREQLDSNDNSIKTDLNTIGNPLEVDYELSQNN